MRRKVAKVTISMMLSLGILISEAVIPAWAQEIIDVQETEVVSETGTEDISGENPENAPGEDSENILEQNISTENPEDVLQENLESTLEENTPTESQENILENNTQNVSMPLAATGLSLSVTYPSNIKCGVPVTFKMTASGGSGDYKYRIAALMDSELVSVYDVSYGSNGKYGDSDEYTFTFYASGTYYIRFSVMDMQTRVSKMTGVYDYPITIQDASYPSVGQIVDTVAAQCKASCSTDFEKALWLHDWILDHADYDYSYSYCSAEGVLARGKGTCESYHRAYVKLLNKAGIETGRIEGNGHVWTAVKMDGKWYQVDSTWDDLGAAYKGTYYEHMYFGLTDDIMGLVHSDHNAAKPGYESTELENNYFIKTGKIKQWSDSFVGTIRQKIAAGQTEFVLPVTDSMPENYKNVIYNLVAYQLSKESWGNFGLTVTYAGSQLSCKAVKADESEPGNGSTNPDEGNTNTGNGNTGSGNTGNGNTGSGNTGNGNTGSGNTGNGNTGSGNTGSGNTGNGNTGNGNTGNGNTGNGNTGNGNTGSGNTGNVDSGNSGTGNGNQNTGSYTQTISDGVYKIESALGAGYLVDVNGGGNNNCANIQLWKGNQTFKVTYLGGGKYSLMASCSGKYVDAENGGRNNGTNVLQYDWNGAENQKWYIQDAGNGYYYIRSAMSELCMDVQGGAAKNSANILLWSAHGGNNQKFKFIKQTETPQRPTDSGNYTQTITDGTYKIESALGNGLLLDVNGGVSNNCANIQLWKGNQTFKVTYLGGGKYSLMASCSGKYVDAENGGRNNGTNVLQYEWNGAENQKWYIQDAGNGYYYIRSAISELCMDVQGGAARNSANILLWSAHGGANQKFRFVKASGGSTTGGSTAGGSTTGGNQVERTIADGTYEIESALGSGLLLDIYGGTNQDCANLQIWRGSQKFKVTYLGSGKYTLTAVCSGKNLDAERGGTANGTNVIQYRSNGGENQKWYI